MVAEFTYQMQVEYLSRTNKVSVSRARKFIKEYRRLLKTRLTEGKKIDVVGIASIAPSVRESLNIVYDDVYGYSSQVRDLSDCMKMEPFDVHHLLKSYIRMLILHLKMGYSIKIKGVLLVKPEQFDGDMLGYVTRLSPTLEKPFETTLKVMPLYGKANDHVVTGDKLIFSLDLCEKLGAPERLRLVDMGVSRLNYIDDSVLG